MDMKTKATATNPTEAYEKMTAATSEATGVIRQSYSTAPRPGGDVAPLRRGLSQIDCCGHGVARAHARCPDLPKVL